MLVLMLKHGHPAPASRPTVAYSHVEGVDRTKALMRKRLSTHTEDHGPEYRTLAMSMVSKRIPVEPCNHGVDAAKGRKNPLAWQATALDKLSWRSSGRSL